MTPLSTPPARGRATIRDVARLAEVGIKTVSRVINDEPNVSAVTAAKVRTAIDALRYEPDLTAGSLKRTGRRTNTIGLLLGSVANPFSAAMHRAIEDVASARGVAAFASSLDEDPERERAAVSAFLRRRVDGLILTCVAPSQDYLTQEQEHGTPIVFVDREPTGITADLVVADNAVGSARAARHLLQHGHRRMAVLLDRPDIWTAAERRRGFLEEATRWGLDAAAVTVVAGLQDEAAARAAVLGLLRSADPPTAVFSAQNLITVGAVQALRDSDAQHRVALIGFDDFALADLLDPGVTVVAQRPDRIGALAAELLLRRLDGETFPPEYAVLPTDLIRRGSGEIRPPG